MGAPAPPTEGERTARAAFVETKNDVALLIEVSNRGLLSGPEEEPQGFEQMLTDLASTAPKLAAAAGRLRHNLPERADVALPEPKSLSSRYFVVWPDGEVFTLGQYLTNRGVFHRRAALLKLHRMHERGYPELRLYDAEERVIIDHKEEP